jgi:hypothetical protein
LVFWIFAGEFFADCSDYSSSTTATVRENGSRVARITHPLPKTQRMGHAALVLFCGWIGVRLLVDGAETAYASVGAYDEGE